MATKIPDNFMVKEFNPMKIKNVDVVFANKPGRNRNVYSTEVLKDAIAYYKKLTQLDPTYRYSFAKHPKDNDEEWIGLIAGAIDDIYFDDNEQAVKADFTLLPSIWGQFIAWLLENEYHIGISLRGKADAQQSSMEIGGSLVSVKQRFNLHLEGVDFVVYPSYIVTNASKENISEQTNTTLTNTEIAGISLLSSLFDNKDSISNVLENFIKDTSNEYGLSNTDIERLLTNVKETPDMGADLDKIKSEIDKLSLQKSQLTAEVAALKEEIEVHGSASKAKQSEISTLDQKISDSQKIVASLNQLETRLTEKQEELSALENKISETSSNYEKLSNDYADFNTRAEKQAVVRIAGQTYSSDTPPKVRLIEATDKVTNADWSNVDTKKVAQLLSLTQDDELSSKVFAIYEKTDKGLRAKLPVYQAFKSSDAGFDIDLILNEEALASASDYVTSRKGIALSTTEKSKAISFLLNKYTDIETSGIHEVPAALKDLSRRSEVLEKIALDEPDTAIETAIETAIISGMITVNDDDKIFESTQDDKIVVNRAIAYDNISAAIMNSLLGINKGKVKEAAVISDNPANDVLGNFVAVLVTAPDGSPTDFSEAFGIESKEDFVNKFISQVNDAIANDDVISALGMVSMAVSTYTQAMVDASDNMNVADHINTAFQAIIASINPETADAVEPQMNEDMMEEGEGVTESVDTEAKTEETSEGTEENSEQQSEEVTESVETETKTTDDNIDGGDEEMLYQDLKEVFEKRFESVQIASQDDLKTVVEKLITDYEQAFSDLTALELKTAKKEKVAKLTEAGVTSEVIESTLAEITSADELEVAFEKLLEEHKKEEVTESVTDDATDIVEAQKSHTVVTKATTDADDMASFKRIFKAV